MVRIYIFCFEITNNLVFFILALLDPTWIQRREKEVAEQQEKEQVYEPGKNRIYFHCFIFI
jgi:hypothetical protein